MHCVTHSCEHYYNDKAALNMLFFLGDLIQAENPRSLILSPLHLFTCLASAFVDEEGFGGVVKSARGKTAENVEDGFGSHRKMLATRVVVRQRRKKKKDFLLDR